nr:glycine betaine/L-proline ABC transporter substrate-binding protein ProX [Lampropedia puyangensis]
MFKPTQWAKALAFTGIAIAASAHAQTQPGQGQRVQPVQTSVAEETFQTLLVARALQALGYDVQDIQETEYASAYLAVANGDASYIAVNWQPLHDDFYANAGGDTKFYRKGTYVDNSAQGYLIDKKTADAHAITNFSQLQQPEIAKLFDANGDGKADLTGCTPGWGCEAVVEHHLDAYELRQTVTHNQGNYAALMADTITRYQQGRPILYYTWTPYWVSGVLVPGKDVVWLEVPFSSMPGAQKDIDTQLPNGKNYGFPINRMNIVANKTFAKNNPAAAKLFAVMQLSIDDVSAQNLRMQQGENSRADIARHTDAWISANQTVFDGWLQQAREAAKP